MKAEFGPEIPKLGLGFGGLRVGYMINCCDLLQLMWAFGAKFNELAGIEAIFVKEHSQIFSTGRKFRVCDFAVFGS